jgi:hypothetical protein
MSTKNAAYSKGNVSTLRYAAAALAFASQLAYLWSLPGEFVIRPLVGAFVLLAATFQGLLAVSLLFGPGRWMLRFGILLNATIAFVWVVTRFWGFPAAVGFTRLPVEPLGLAATAGELALIVLLVRLRKNQNKEGR